MFDLTRKRVRYFCFRIQNEVEGGAPAPEIPEGFKEYFEEQELFTGWENFAATWDVTKDDPFKLYKRRFTIHEEWNATLRAVVPELPVKKVE